MVRALMVIDVQNDYFAGGVLPLWQADDTEARTVAALAKAREAGDRIILIQHVSTANTGLFAPGGTGVETRPAILAAAKDAPVVIKHYADAFQETELMTHLDGVDELLVCGMMTQNCVAFTAMSRDADAFRVRVVGDLCAAPIEVVHQIALGALNSKIDVVEASAVWG